MTGADGRALSERGVATRRRLLQAAEKVFSEREGYEFPLLSDFWPHGAVAQSYGVFNEVTGFANRGTFLVDKDGIVRFAEMNKAGEGRDAQDWRDAIAKL